MYFYGFKIQPKTSLTAFNAFAVYSRLFSILDHP